MGRPCWPGGGRVSGGQRVACTVRFYVRFAVPCTTHCMTCPGIRCSDLFCPSSEGRVIDHQMAFSSPLRLRAYGVYSWARVGFCEVANYSGWYRHPMPFQPMTRTETYSASARCPPQNIYKGHSKDG